LLPDSFHNDKGEALQTSLRHVPRLFPQMINHIALETGKKSMVISHDGSLQSVIKSRRPMPAVDMEKVTMVVLQRSTGSYYFFNKELNILAEEMSRKAEMRGTNILANAKDFIASIAYVTEIGEDKNENSPESNDELSSDVFDDVVAIAVKEALEYITSTIESHSHARSRERFEILISPLFAAHE
jgi:hypothetical protein